MIISKHFLFILVIVLSQVLKAQNFFQKKYAGADNDYCFAVSACADKSIVFAGYTSSFGAGTNDCFVTKIDSVGTISWSKSYGGNRDDEAYSIKQTTDGGFIVAGYSKSFNSPNYNAYAIKLNAIGDTVWTKIYGGSSSDYANCVQQTMDGGFVFAGATTSFVTDTTAWNIYLIKTDVNGNPVWTKSLGGIGNISDAYSIRQTTDKGYVVTGYTNAFGEINGDVFLLKTDSVGNTSWLKTYGSNGVDWGNSVKQTADGGYIIAGSSSFDTTSLIDVYLIKTNSVGDTLWTRTYGGTGYDFGQAIEIADSGFVLAGYANSCTANNYDFLYMKIDTSGNITSFASNDISTDDEANSISVQDNKSILAGITYNGNDYDVYVMEEGANGNACFNNLGCLFNTNKVSTQYATQVVQTYTCSNLFYYTNTIISDAFNSNSDVCTMGISQVSNSIQGISVYPNPNNGTFVVLCDEVESPMIVIKNMLGETVYVSSKKEIDVQQLPNGAYMLFVQSAQNVFFQKIVINK